jgi:hypothetical protein
MKKRNIIFIILLFIIIFIIYLIITKEEKYFNKVEIENIKIFNTIKNKEYLDTIVYAGAKSLEIENLIIVLKPLTEKEKEKLIFDSDYDLKAHIKGENYTYIIWLDPNLGRRTYINIISHEMIHLKQYYNKELTIIDNIPFWKGEKVDLIGIDYKKLPWEEEAFSNQYKIENKMRKILY